MGKRKEKSDQNAVAELTREGLYKENKWLWEENQKLKEHKENLIRADKKKTEHIEELEEENKKLKEINESQNEEIQRFKDNAMQDMREITELEIENKNLKESNTILKKGGQVVFNLEKKIDELLEENEKLKETIKDHQLYEEKLEHRIIELEELLHGE